MGFLPAQLSSALNTCFAFGVALSTLPVLFVSFVAVRITKHFWLKLLSSRYPHLEFVRTDTIRSLLDTHRNQGIINVLLCVRGPFDPELIKHKLLQHVIEKRDKYKEVMFPKMRAALVSCWGNYAWDTSLPVRIENHFIVSSGVFRGRPISDLNIQEYVSDIVSKYFPTEQPPWQYIVIPYLSQDNKYYVLVRVHHLLLTGKKSINIGDLLLIEQSTEAERVSIPSEVRKTSPLAKLFPAPSAIPELYAKIGEICSNTWNEFVSEYDPVESPRALKSPPGAFHCAGLALIITACALHEVSKRRSAGSARDAASSIRLLIAALKQECQRRELTLGKLLIAPLVTVDPRKWPLRLLGLMAVFMKFAATWPLRLKDEISALKALKTTGHPINPNTIAWRWGSVAQLAWRAAGEAQRGAVAALRAPAQLWEDAVIAGAGKRHALQTASLCGRKVIAWSRALPRAPIERVATALGVSDTDIMMYAAGEALRAYFEDAKQEVPSSVLTTARTATQDFLYAFAEGDGKYFKKSQTGGMVCIPLEIGASPKRIASILSRACRRQSAIASAWAAQARFGAVTRAVPSPAAKLALNALSRRYAVSYAEISAPPGSRERTTAWGHTLDHVVYWRPPQANISMSLTVIQYADTIRFTVMCDARLSPHHAAAAARWPAAIEELVARVDIEQAAIQSSQAHASNIAQKRTMQTLPRLMDSKFDVSSSDTREHYLKDGDETTDTARETPRNTKDPRFNGIATSDVTITPDKITEISGHLFSKSERELEKNVIMSLEGDRSVQAYEGIDEVDKVSMLKPPPTHDVSPAPMRRKISHE